MKPHVHFLLALTLVENLGPKGLTNLLKIHGSPKTAFESIPRGVRRALFLRAEEINRQVTTLGARVVSCHCKEYPFNLRNICDAPGVIYVKGTIPQEIDKAIAVVGTRKCSEEGKRFAEMAVDQMAQNGFPLVSGMALGIDTAAHKAAVFYGLKSVAVFAHGLDRIHPKSNVRLAHEILDKGGAWISEHPPGTNVLKWMFAARNRILVGLCVGTVLAESPESGGSMISLKLALDYGRATYAFQPPNAYMKRWDGNRRVIADNKGFAIKTMAQWMRKLHLEVPAMKRTTHEMNDVKKAAKANMDAALEFIPDPCKSVYKEVSVNTISAFELSKKLKTNIKIIRTRLFILETLQRVERLPGDCYSRL